MIFKKLFQVCVTKGTEEAVAIRSGATHALVLPCQVMDLLAIDVIPSILIFKRSKSFHIANQRSGFRNLQQYQA
jgi:hypothetical protein